MRAHDQEGVCKGLCTLARVLSAWILFLFAAGDGELRAPLCVAFRSLFVAAGIFFQLFASAFFASCCFCAFFVNWGRVVLRVCSAILFGWEKHGMQVSSGVRGNVAGQFCVGFSVLSKWLQTPRLETRTKESNMCASVVELRILWRAMKVRDAKRRGSNPCCLQLHRPIWILRTLLCVQLERFAF